jgi:excinuclease UvrABC helicase subunit UvrB
LIATTERRKMWVLADGTKLPVEIAKIVNVTPMSVSRFLSLTVSAGVIEYERGKPPTRILDYVPAEWLDLLTPSNMTTPQVSEQGGEQNGT